MRTTTLKVSGMMCEGCVANVKKALEGMPGVSSAEVDLKKGTAVVQHENIADEMLISAIVDAGFEVTKIQ